MTCKTVLPAEGLDAKVVTVNPDLWEYSVQNITESVAALYLSCLLLVVLTQVMVQPLQLCLLVLLLRMGLRK